MKYKHSPDYKKLRKRELEQKDGDFFDLLRDFIWDNRDSLIVREEMRAYIESCEEIKAKIKKTKKS